MMSAISLSILGLILVGSTNIYNQLEQQILHRFRIGWELIITAVLILQFQALGAPDPITNIMTEVMKTSHLFVSLFCR